MTKSGLIENLGRRFPQLALTDAEFSVNLMLVAITHALVQGGRVEIRGFGSFHTRTRPGRTARNPKTGNPVVVPAKSVPHFKAGKCLRERVDIAGQGPVSSQSCHD